MATDVWLQRWTNKDLAKQQDTDQVNTYVALGVATAAFSLLGEQKQQQK